MTKKYYVRIRGRAQGPFPLEKMRALVKRGQVARTHEISSDGVSWSAAADCAELFELSTAGTSTRASDTEPAPVSGAETTGAPAVAVGKTAPLEDAWYFADGESQSGPIDRMSLQRLFETGRLPPETPVWATGMANWEPAHTVPGLIPRKNRENDAPRHRQVDQSLADQPQAERRGDESYSAARIAPLMKSMRTWTMLIAITGLILCTIQFIRGIVSIIADHGVLGLSILLATAVPGVGYLMLLGFAWRAGRFLENRSENRLLAAVRALRIFWMYVGILLCILLSLVVLAISLVLAGVDLAMAEL